jgi:phosphoglycerate dehydrogenase-like enzyme
VSLPEFSTSTADPPVPAAPVVIALRAAEANAFFPEDVLRALPGAWWCDVSGLDAARWSAILAARRPRVVVSGWSTPPIADASTVAGGGSVEYVCHVVGSVRHVVARPAIARGLKVGSWGGLVAPAVAEHALLLLLAGLRNLGVWPGHLATAGWEERMAGISTRSLRGRRVCVHGFGAVARELVRLLRPFDVTIAAYSAGVPAELIRGCGVEAVGSLEALFQNAEIMVECEALTPETRGSVNAAVLAGLRAGAVFVNVGRGAVIDEAALLRIARERGLRVASDVFAHEPLAEDAPFRALPGAVLSPHIAGPTHDQYAACGARAAENVRRFLRGETPDGLLTPEQYDRSTEVCIGGRPSRRERVRERESETADYTDGHG